MRYSKKDKTFYYNDSQIPRLKKEQEKLKKEIEDLKIIEDFILKKKNRLDLINRFFLTLKYQEQEQER